MSSFIRKIKRYFKSNESYQYEMKPDFVEVFFYMKNLDKSLND